jgi:hypothetical protein
MIICIGETHEKLVEANVEQIVELQLEEGEGKTIKISSEAARAALPPRVSEGS